MLVEKQMDDARLCGDENLKGWGQERLGCADVDASS